MSSIGQFIKKQWFSILLLAGVAFGVVWAVQTMRPRGSMSVVEAQSMDMTSMKAPTGAFPVGTDFVLERMVGGSSVFPATVQAWNDEDVVARVDGLVSKLTVYPGDTVKPGQLVGTIDAKELDSMSSASQLGASAARLKASAMQSMVAQEQAALDRAKADVRTAEANTKQASAMLKTANTKVAVAQKDIPRMQAEIDEQQAEATLAEENATRYKGLYDKGYVSKQQYDEAVRTRDAVRSKLRGAEAAKQQAEANLIAAQSEVATAQAGLETANSELAAMRTSVHEAEARVRTARDQAVAEGASANAMSAEAAAKGTMASYTQLRALSGGVVTERVVSPGTPVMAGQVVLKIKSDSRLRVQADLPQILSGKVRVGSPARVKVNGQVMETTISSVFPYVEGGSRTFRVEAAIDNPGKGWDVGSYSELEVFTESQSSRLAVRNEAIKTASDGSKFVWLVHEGKVKDDPNAEYTCTMHPQVSHKGPGLCPICKMDLVPRDARGNTSVERRAVEIGTGDSSFTEIVSGLSEGDQVTAQGDSELFPGAAVKPVKWTKSGPEELPAGTGTSSHKHGSTPQPPKEKPAETPKPQMKQTGLKYTCPMHPQVVKDEPGKCPICKMDLVPLDEDTGE